MSFLLCPPSVFVIEDKYEILVNATANGIIAVRIGDELYYEENSGVLSSEKDYAKIRLPQALLNTAKEYEIVYRKTIDRKGYYSKMAEPQTEKFAFKPMEKTEKVNMYHIADVHYRFADAAPLASFFGDDLDVLVVNGDIGEVETVQNYLDVCKFVGEMSQGKIPVIFARGNHDTRGKLAERFTDFFPCNGKDTFFWFELGALSGVVLDCGEDKVDTHLEYGAMEYFKADSPEVYGGVNSFSPFRQRELQFLKGLQRSKKDTLFFAVSHICPVHTTVHIGGAFDIERECYAAWNTELERLDTKFMLTGHMHRAYMVMPDDERSTLAHNYPVVVGSAVQKETIIGAAVTVSKESMEVKFTDKNGNITETHTVKL